MKVIRDEETIGPERTRPGVYVASDGSPKNTTVMIKDELDRWVTIPDVTEVTWTIETSGFARCTIQVRNVQISAKGTLDDD